MPVVLAVGPSPYWYMTRGAGSVSLLLLTAAVALGVIDVSRWRSERWPRFIVDGLHRNVSLLALGILAIHILTSVLDSFAPLGLKDAILPFASTYRPLWIGFGALAFDILLAVALTSVVRRGLGYRTWRAVHWAAYASWPLAMLHGFGSGSDATQSWMLGMTLGCLAIVLAAVGWRITLGWPQQYELRVFTACAVALSPIFLLVWLIGGPLGSNWAARAGTPARLLAGVRPSPARPSSVATLRFPLRAQLQGTVHQSPTSASGLVEIDLPMKLGAGATGTLDARLVGQPLAGGGLTLTQSAVTLGPPAQPQLFGGRIVSLQGSRLNASVANAAGQSVRLTLDVSIDQTDQTIRGTVRSQGSPSGGAK